jgi:hypothetical protein
MKASDSLKRLPLLMALAAAPCISSSQAAVLDLAGPWSSAPFGNQWQREVHPGLFAVASYTGVTNSGLAAFGNDGTFSLTGDPAKNPYLTYSLSLYRRDDGGALVPLLPSEFTGVRIESGDLDSQIGSHVADVWGLKLDPNGTYSLPSTLTTTQRFPSIPEYTQFSLREDLWGANLVADDSIGSDAQKDFTATVNLPSFQTGDFVFGITTPAGVPEGGPLLDRGFLLRISGEFTPIPEPSSTLLGAAAAAMALFRRRRF